MSSPNGKPLREVSLRGIYDAVEKKVTPTVEDVVHSGGFSDGTRTIMAIRRRAGRAVEGLTARILHAVNMPAGTDIRKLRRQLGELDYEVRRLRIELAEAGSPETGKEGDDDADS